MCSCNIPEVNLDPAPVELDSADTRRSRRRGSARSRSLEIGYLQAKHMHASRATSSDARTMPTVPSHPARSRVPDHPQPLAGLRALDLFSGAGGLSCAFEWAGGEVVGAIEYDANAAETFKVNHGDARVWVDDIRSVSTQEVARAVGPVDMVIGGPMCQGVSQRGPRDPADERNFASRPTSSFHELASRCSSTDASGTAARRTALRPRRTRCGGGTRSRATVGGTRRPAKCWRTRGG